VASATKTYSGDLSTAIVGKISDAIEKYQQTKEIEKSKASPEVKTAANKLLSNESDGSVSTTKDTDLKSYIARVFGTELDASLIQTESKVSKLSDQVLSIGESIVNTQKLVINQNELMEDKFDEILKIFKSNDRREQEKKDRLEAEGTELGIEKSMEDFGTRKALGTAKGDLTTGGLQFPFKALRLLGLWRKAGVIRKALTNEGTSTLLRKAVKTRTTKKFVKTAGNEWMTRGLTNLAKGEIITNATTKGGKRIAKKTAEQIAAEKAAKQVSPDLILGLFRQPAIRKALISTLGEERAMKLVLRLSGKAAPFLQTAYGIGEGIVRLSPFVGGSDWKGSMLSLGSAIPYAGYAFTALDIFRDIDRESYTKHIEPNMRILMGIPTKMPSRKNLSDFFNDALGVTPEYEMGTKRQPSFMNKNNFFEKSVVASSMLIASAAGVTPQVKAEIRSSGLGHIPVEKLNINTDIGSISRSFSTIGLRKNNLISEVIPSLPPLPGFGNENGDPVKEPWRIFGIPLPDFGITEFIGGTMSAVRDIVWGRKDDGYWGPKWLGWKRKPKEVEPKTTITGQITDLEELAFLKLIRHVESSQGPDSYNTWFGGRTDMDMTSMTLQEVYEEQTRRLNSGEATYNDITSAAVGVGQFMNPLEQAREMYASRGEEFDPTKITFNKELQLQLMMDLAKRKRGIDVSEPLTLEGLGELNKEWSGLGPFYGQTNRSLEESLNLYNKFLEELKFTPVEDRRISQVSNTSFETEDILDPSGSISPIIVMNNNTYVRNSDSSLGGIPRGNNDWANKYKLYSLAG
jgi:hypothetical protein